MELEQIIDLIDKINGCTFASLDVITKPSKGVRRVIIGEQVIIFSMKHGSGYENAVRRRLAEIGEDPETFVVGPLPWGERLEDYPIIFHKGKDYLQTLSLKAGETEMFIGDTKVDPSLVSWVRPHDEDRRGRGVIFRTYELSGITAIRMMREERIAAE
jgi:hypothetical protein